ncbi:iron ABC transporter permease [Paenibacillus sp. Marseille-Q4541]|uniref:FecCD family ABC transporter permease n=1 Tax=Paenibacillus sp. Marseille-Q4541 TaxID=2831522 RepID=UPI001BA8AD67|nr:iron ABC transporter permease [Paenibacillus sp. Marseille-Q4541]
MKKTLAEQMQHSKNKKQVRQWTVLTIFAVLMIVFVLISMNTGFSKLTPGEVLNTLLGKGTSRQSLILFEFRLPRIIISMLVGAGLAVSGCILQGVSRNALADPGILGITTGAGLFVVLYLSFYTSAAEAPTLLLPFLALVGGSIIAAIIYILSYSKKDGLNPNRMVLTGIAVTAAVNGLMIVLMLRLNPNKYDMVASWLAGSIWGSTWNQVITLLPWVLLLIVFAFLKSRMLDALSLDENVASSLGVNLSRQRLLLLLIAVGLAAACVAFTGGIGFVGLIAPHLARRLVGPGHRMLLPASALGGALLLLMADTLGRSILPSSEIHAGIMVAIIGAPYFLYLLSRSKM